MSSYLDETPLPPNISTEEKPVRRCERCDREADHYVEYLDPDNDVHTICWSCQERDDKNYFMKPEWRRERSGGRFLPGTERR